MTKLAQERPRSPAIRQEASGSEGTGMHMNPISTSLAASVVAALVLPNIAVEAAPQPSASASAKWKHPKTPWGDPDLQGTWPISHLMSVPLQRDKKYGERLEFTPEELAEQKKAVEAQNTRYSEEDKAGRISMGHWVEATDLPAQTSLIIDPPDGQLPAQTAAGKEMSARMGSDWNRDVFDSVADFGTWNRCITRGLPEGMFPNPYNNGIQIVQAPGYVVLNLEMVHEARVVPVGKMPPLDNDVKQWHGSSRGHWEGNTLVVETANFNGQTSMTDVPTRGSPRDPTASSTELKLVERFERTSDDRITYTVTITDPVTQTSSWTARLPWKRDDSYTIYEYACHEDNDAVRNFITSSRAKRAQEAAAKQK
jgi:hypothetical protein